MNLKKVINKGRRKLELEKPVRLKRNKEPFKLPITGTVAEAFAITEDTRHIIFANTSKQDFILKYKIEHELCHLKLNEMDLRSLNDKLKEIKFKDNVEKNKSSTVVLIVMEFYAEWMCHEVFEVPKKIIDAYIEFFTRHNKVKARIESDIFAFMMELICLLMYKRLGYSVNIDITAKIVKELGPELSEWVAILDDFSKKLPKLPVSINEPFINNIYEMIKGIYPKNPISIQ